MIIVVLLLPVFIELFLLNDALCSRSWYAVVAHSHSQSSSTKSKGEVLSRGRVLESPLPRVSSPRALCQSRSLVP